MNLIDLYAPICACPNTTKQCPGTVNSPFTGIPPRGFYTKGTHDSVKVLIVGKNPGHVLDHEKPFYIGKSSHQIAEDHLNFAGQTFSACNSIESKKNRSLTFHRNMLRYFSYFLDIAPEEVFVRCAYTNVVKCQTVGEQDLLDKTTIKTCLDKHFQRELDFFSPKVIVALGNEAYRELAKLKLKAPIFKLKHPSYHYRKADEAGILEALKGEIQTALSTVKT